ncbi:protein vreteno-like [Culicoides brevitarsis]|uniref:protein vreteno-like n=1 Tax=Culicoides brevitarsis TaxID=469753 RepID=UPI00307C89F0
MNGPFPMNNSNNYLFFVTFETIDGAQNAIEQINRICKPMRADFSKPREKNDQISSSNKSLDKISDHEGPNMKIRKFPVPLLEKYDFKFPKSDEMMFSKENFLNSDLSKVDPDLLFFNETALCDILTLDEDIEELQSVTDSYKLENFIWSYKFSQQDEARIKKFLKNSAGMYDEIHDIHSKRNEKFEKLREKLGECKFCKNLTTRKSKITKNFFCSVVCQQKFDQGVTETTENEEKIKENFSLTYFPLDKNANYVIITAIIAQNVVYVRPSDLSTTTKYYRLLEEVNEKCQDAPIILKTPKIGELIAVKTENGNFFRAIILKNDSPAKIRVAFLDTGEVSYQKRAQLRKLPQNLWSLPIYVQKIILSDVPTSYFNLNAVKYLSKIAFRQGQRELLIKFDDLKHSARLYQQDICLNVELKSIIKIKKPSGTHFNVTDIPSVDAKSDENPQKLMILENAMIAKGEISCINVDYVKKLEMLHEKIQSYGKSLKLPRDHMYTPGHNEVALIRIGDVWFRAICFEIVGDKHPTMESLDFGFFTMCHISNIVELPRKLLDRCYMQNYCIHDAQRYSEVLGDEKNGKIEKIKEMLPLGKVITAEKIVKNNEEDFIQIPKRFVTNF